MKSCKIIALSKKGEELVRKTLEETTFANRMMMKMYYKIRITQSPYTIEFIVKDGIMQTKLRSEVFVGQVTSDLQSEGLKYEDFKIEAVE